ncbi:DUF799 domain-containing protein [Zhongshania sp. BJYM1]|uniref:DUF799 domain-containing protein n=1 Tax=Zhongshania aquatica TaxID=2965069 RepID=UPI0022B52F06|nr:GNA1162 family protein [Marortus sp. BJYM1]
MNISTRNRALVFALLALSLVGCQVAPPYDYSALQASKPRSILVIPPLNESVDVNAPYTFISTVSKPLAEKGYYVFPVAVVDQFLKENGLPSPGEMNGVPLEKLRENIGADAVLYTTINQWGQKFQLLSSVTIVDSELKLIDARTGELLWTTRAFAQQSSSDGGSGLAGAIVGAIVQQIAGSISDQTPALSSGANAMAINAHNQGLLPGPYLPEDAHQQ